ncbi:hypothetical protein PoB_001680800 [Plakobranchus ocellatus]|uniref:Apple domain-containing protein n=1 Tax=Plakobranchus ocellatus TaxID=259542 RepID=A0AAV3Z6I3_9GAST|nr:hypothetical protein PoB_001680800 [Plakobranchus ocellatus]
MPDDTTSTMTWAYGTTVNGRKPTDTKFSMSVSKVHSYLECVIMCGQETLCRVVEFRSDILTCNLLGPGTLDGTTENAASTTFIRGSFEAAIGKYASTRS